MRGDDEINSALVLVESGLNDCEVARRTGIPRSTVREWRAAGWRAGQLPARGRRLQTCEGCEGGYPNPPAGAYAYLLGLYLGDGCISRHPRTYRMRLFLDARYPGIVEECVAALEAIVPAKTAWRGFHGNERCVEVGMSWNHWPCFFPQHGPGRKHLRPILLAPWQEAIVDSQHRPFLRGLIHSDGCRVVANDRGRASVRYHFANLSEDIKALYSASLDSLGIPWTRPNAKDIAVYRKRAMARLDEFIGPKA